MLQRVCSKFKIYKSSASLINKAITYDNQIVIQKIQQGFYLENEINILKQLDHKNIIKYIDSDKKSLWIEYVPNGSLHDYIENQPLSEDIARYYFHQLVEALDFCQEKNIYHRDIKLKNLLLDENFDLKLADFGFSLQSDGSYQKRLMGSPYYKAPEINERKQYLPEQSDIFSLGIVLFKTVAGRFPFEKNNIECQDYNKFILNKQDEFWDKYGEEYQFSDELKDLVNKMLSYDPNERINLDEIKNHAWYQQDLPSNEYVSYNMKFNWLFK